ncbi:MAG TPA: hypothetical protein VH395_12665, partial [Jatrophihabitantaceae bacterium]
RRKLRLDDAPAHDWPPTDVETTIRRYLMYVLLPGWLVPSVADWWYHRRSHIEDTTGLKEAALHTAMAVEVGVPVAVALTMRITRPVAGAMAAAALAHAATASWDVRIAYDSPREVTPGEQHVHGFLEVLPLTSLATLAALHWQQIVRPAPGQRAFSARRPPLPRWYLASAGTVTVAVIVGPYRDEMARCIRVWRRRRGAVAAGAVQPGT